MKILVLSDTHGQIENVIAYIEDSKEKFDKLIHLGDYCHDAKEIESIVGIETIMVRGNGDFDELKSKSEEVIELEGKRIFLTHGHNYNVKRDLNRLYYKGLSLEADIVLFGHTHVQMIGEYNELTIINPGSPAIPKGGYGKSMFVLELDQGLAKKKIINLK